jgi:hypothetical protein
LAGTSLSKLSAQQSLKNWLTKCESLSTVDMTVINYKNPETKKEERKAIKVIFSNNEALLKDLLNAFEQDKKNAYNVSEKRSKGVVHPDFCRFNEKGFDTRYVFEFKSNGDVIVTAQFFYVEEQGG